MTPLFLLDNSVVQRIHRSTAVADKVLALIDVGQLASCLPQALEECFSARSLADFDASLAANRHAKVFLPPDAEVADIALDIQRRLFEVGLGRGVGVSDLQIAATAIRHSTDQRPVTVVHYDADFDLVARVRADFRARWIVPRGTVD